MTTTTKALLTVKCISRKLAKQIRFVPCDWNEGSMHKELWTKLMTERASVVGWCPADQIEAACKTLGPIWLVKAAADLYWWIPPTHGPLFDLHNPGLEQLFVD